MSDEICAGDVVVLKSGGPEMTVDWAEAEYGKMKACCSWFNDKNEVKQQVFPVTSLEKTS